MIVNLLFSPDRELFEKILPIQNSSMRATGRLLRGHSYARVLHVHCTVIGREFRWASFPGTISSGWRPELPLASPNFGYVWPPTTDALAQRSGEGTAQECPRSLVKPKCRLMAQSRSSGVLHSRSGHRRITDVPARMSVHRRIPDAAPSGAEGRSLTQVGHQPYQSTNGGRLAALQTFRRARSPTERII